MTASLSDTTHTHTHTHTHACIYEAEMFIHFGQT